MFRRLLKKLHGNTVRRKSKSPYKVTNDLRQNIDTIHKIVGESDDIIQRDITLGRDKQAVIFYIDGLSDEDSLEEDVIKPLLQLENTMLESVSSTELDTFITQRVLSVAEYTISKTYDQAMEEFLTGKPLLLIDGVRSLMILGTRGFDQRGVEEPESEVLVRGPRDGFTETLQTNTMLIRRRVHDVNLVIQKGKLGRRAKKQFAICYH